MTIKTKYGGTLDMEAYKDYCVHSIFKILPLKEEGKAWEQFLEGFLVELSGIQRLSGNADFICLMGKLEGLLARPYDFSIPTEKKLFKKIIFDSIVQVKSIDFTKGE